MEGPLKNPRHEKFAVLVAGGSTQADAYRGVYPKSRKWKDDGVRVEASKLTNKVLTRIQELQAATAEKATITKSHLVTLLADVLTTPIGDVDEKSLLCQKYRVTDKGAVEYEMVSKLGSAQEIAKLLGFYTPVKVEGQFAFKPDDEMRSILHDAAAKAKAVRRSQRP